MPRYRVLVRSTVYEYRTLDVDAANEAMVATMVTHALYEEGPTPDADSTDAGDDDIITCEELKE
jgi:hypothetical protein